MLGFFPGVRFMQTPDFAKRQPLDIISEKLFFDSAGYYILWSISSSTINPRFQVTYINLEFEYFQKK